jgi:hypothetical protein
MLNIDCVQAISKLKNSVKWKVDHMKSSADLVRPSLRTRCHNDASVLIYDLLHETMRCDSLEPPNLLTASLPPYFNSKSAL